jgi:hypothetical protein
MRLPAHSLEPRRSVRTIHLHRSNYHITPTDGCRFILDHYISSVIYIYIYIYIYILCRCFEGQQHCSGRDTKEKNSYIRAKSCPQVVRCTPISKLTAANIGQLRIIVMDV